MSTDSSQSVDEALQAFKLKLAKDRNRITFFRAPFRTCYHFSIVLSQWIHQTSVYLLTHRVVLTTAPIVLLVLGAIVTFDNEERLWWHQLHNAVSFSCWWIILGVLSSIGLGEFDSYYC